jgi:prophage tail gpP-like protein
LTSSERVICDGKTLWEEGKEYPVKSPMAMLNQTLKVQTVTFTQDNQSGTQTTLLLVLPGLLKGSPNYDATPDGAPPTPAPQPEAGPYKGPGLGPLQPKG